MSYMGLIGIQQQLYLVFGKGKSFSFQYLYYPGVQAGLSSASLAGKADLLSVHCLEGVQAGISSIQTLEKGIEVLLGCDVSGTEQGNSLCSRELSYRGRQRRRGWGTSCLTACQRHTQ